MPLITIKKIYKLAIVIFWIFAISRMSEILKTHRYNLQKDLHYSNLEKLLSRQDWEKADYETSLLMQKITDQHRNILYNVVRFILIDQFHQRIIINDISCEDLLKIDNLWTRYSKNRLGFTVQRTILKPLDSELKIETEEDMDSRFTRRTMEILKWKEYYPYPNYLSELEKQHDQKIQEEHYQKIKNIPISKIPYGYLPYKLYTDTMFTKIINSWGYINMPHNISSTVKKVEECSSIKPSS
ncbi:MAG: GUN4 domain-containing protein [Crocosphaera sp.]